MDNKELCKKYPWLIPTDYKGDVIEGYDYSYTLLDLMPEGWRMAFGEEMQEELLAALKKDGLENDYGISDIKEKYGELRWYDYCGSEETDKIVDKYTRLSTGICACCGKPSTTMISFIPLCDDCGQKR